MSEHSEPGYFAIVPAPVRYDEKLQPNAKLLYGEITALCKKEGYCYAHNSYFAKLYKVSNQAISNWIKQLQKRGYIKTKIDKKRGNKRKIYLRNAPEYNETEEAYKAQLNRYKAQLETYKALVETYKAQLYSIPIKRTMNNISKKIKKEREGSESVTKSEKEKSSPSLSQKKSFSKFQEKEKEPEKKRPSSGHTFQTAAQKTAVLQDSPSGKIWLSYFSEQVTSLTQNQITRLQTGIIQPDLTWFDTACQYWADGGYAGRKLGKIFEVMEEYKQGKKTCRAIAQGGNGNSRARQTSVPIPHPDLTINQEEKQKQQQAIFDTLSEDEQTRLRSAAEQEISRYKHSMSSEVYQNTLHLAILKQVPQGAQP